MAVTIIPLGLNPPGVTKLIRDADANATPENHLAEGAASILAVEIDNTANTGAVSYVKLFNGTAPAVGTTAPDMILPVSGGTKRTFHFTRGCPAFTAGLSVAGLTAGGSAGTTGPTSDVIVDVLVG